MPNFSDDPVVSNTTSGNAIEGVSVKNRGLVGRSDEDYGIRGHSKNLAGIRGSSDESRGVEGWATKGEGVVGLSKTGHGVWGQTEGGSGVLGTSISGYGVSGISKGSAGIRGTGENGRGVEGWSTSWEGVVGVSTNNNGVWGQADGPGDGIHGTSKSGVGVFGKGGRLAGLFEGKVQISEALFVEGLDVIAYLRQLQQRVEILETIVKVMLPPLASLNIKQTTPVQSGGAFFEISAPGFRPNVYVHIGVLGKNSAPDVLKTDGAGFFSHNAIRITCFSGEILKIWVYDPENGQRSAEVPIIVS